MFLSREQCRQIDRRAEEEFGIPSIVLMENAGRGCVDVVMQMRPAEPVVILCGKGNNGGDGFVVARHLEIRGIDVRVFLLARADDLAGDARTNCDIVAKTNIPIISLSDVNIAASLQEHGGDAGLLVDALLGTGASGAPREPIATAIRWMNAQSCRILAVDTPSGVDCDTGESPGDAVKADVTCTFVGKKRAQSNPNTAVHFGEVHVLDIGAPRCLIAAVAGRE